MRALRRSADEAITATLARPKASAAVTILGLIGAVVAAAVSPVAAAAVVILLFACITAMFVFTLRQRALFEGPYRVLEDHTEWDLVAPDGSEARVTRRLDVRFNYPVIALEEFAWGDGDQFSDYSSDFGREVFRHRDGERQRLVVALDATAARNDERTLISSRTVRGGFMAQDEWIDLSIDKPSGCSKLVVLFPAARVPSAVHLKRFPSDRLELLTPEVEGGRHIVRIALEHPRVGEKIQVRWSW